MSEEGYEHSYRGCVPTTAPPDTDGSPQIPVSEFAINSGQLETLLPVPRGSGNLSYHRRKVAQGPCPLWLSLTASWSKSKIDREPGESPQRLGNLCPGDKHPLLCQFLPQPQGNSREWSGWCSPESACSHPRMGKPLCFCLCLFLSVSLPASSYLQKHPLPLPRCRMAEMRFISRRPPKSLHHLLREDFPMSELRFEG